MKHRQATRRLAPCAPRAAATAAASTAATLALALVGAARAQVLYWDVNGDAPGAGGPAPVGSWDLLTANWSTSAAGAAPVQAWAPGSTAVFAAGNDAVGTYTVTVAPGTTIPGVNGIVFEEGSVRLNTGTPFAATLELAGGTVHAAGAHEIGLSLAGSAGLTKTGTGSVTLLQFGTYTGVTTINQGRLFVGHRQALGSTTPGDNVVFAPGVNGLGVTVIGNTEGIGKAIVLNGGSGDVTGAGQLDGTGVFGVWSGTVTLDSATSTFGTGHAMITATGPFATLRIDGQIVGGGAGPANNSWTKSGVGTVVLGNANTYDGITRLVQGKLIVESDAALGAGGAAGSTFIYPHTTSNSLATLALRAPNANPSGFTYSTDERITLRGLSRVGEGVLDNLGGHNIFAGEIQLANESPLPQNQVVIPTTIGVSQGTLTLAGVVRNFEFDPAPAHHSLTKVGPGQLNLTAANTFSGPAVVEAGTLSFAGADGRVDAVGAGSVQSSFDVRPGASLRFDNTAGVRNDRITVPTGQATGNVPVRLYGADFTLVGNASAPTNTSNVGGLLHVMGHSSVTVIDGGGGTVFNPGGRFSRAGRGTALFRGNLGNALPGPGSANVFLPPGSSTVVGGVSGPGTPGVLILPWAIGDASITGRGTDLVTYNAGGGVRRLIPGVEYFTGPIAGQSGPNFANVDVSAAQNVNVDTAVNAIKFSGPGAHLSLGAELRLNAGVLLNASGGSIALADAGGTLTLSREGYVYALDAVRIDTPVRGTNGLVKSGAGTLQLTNHNNAFGTLTINEGLVRVTNEAQLGPATGSAIVLNGGYLFADGGGITTLSPQRQLIVNSKFGGITGMNISSPISGPGALRIVGGGMLVLGGNNTYQGGTVLENGIVSISSDANLGSSTIPFGPDANGAAGLWFSSNGELRVTETMTLAPTRAVHLDGHTNVISVTAGKTLNYPNFSWGRGGLTKAGDGTMVIGSAAATEPNQYLGRTRVAWGTLAYIPNDLGLFVGLSNNPPELVPDYFLLENRATLQVRQRSTTSSDFGSPTRGITMGSNGGGVLDTPAGISWTVNAPITGPGLLGKSGSGTLTLNVPNTYVSGTNLVGGTVRIADDNRLGLATATIGFDGGTLQATAPIASMRNFSVGAGGGTFDTGASNSTLGGNLAGAGTFTKAGTGALHVKHVRTGALAIAAGRLTVTPGAAPAEPQHLSNIGALSIAGGAAPTATLDISNNALVVDYAGASPLDTIKAQVSVAYNGGAWDGNGITSASADGANFAVGYAEASALAPVPSVFGTADDTAVLLRLTRYGDANLDGAVDLQDFNRLAASFGSVGAAWSQGDFNFDGNVNLQDFNRLAGNFGLGVSGAQFTPQDWASLAAAVPEPTLLSMLSAPWLLGRRRRAAGTGGAPTTMAG